MCRAIARVLRPGGRFVTANSNPAEPTVAFPAARAYGFSRRVEGELVEGAPIVLEFFLPEGSFEVTNYYLSAGTMEEAFRAAGLRESALARGRGIAGRPGRVRPGVLGGLPRPSSGGLHRVRQVGLRQGVLGHDAGVAIPCVKMWWRSARSVIVCGWCHEC